jgi:hypothetical protein
MEETRGIGCLVLACSGRFLVRQSGRWALGMVMMIEMMEKERKVS